MSKQIHSRDKISLSLSLSLSISIYRREMNSLARERGCRRCSKTTLLKGGGQKILKMPVLPTHSIFGPPSDAPYPCQFPFPFLIMYRKEMISLARVRGCRRRSQNDIVRRRSNIFAADDATYSQVVLASSVSRK
jgi:hypothetical protein